MNPKLPKSYAPFDVFDENGKLVMGELVPVGGSLNAPWGMALAASGASLSGTMAWR